MRGGDPGGLPHILRPALSAMPHLLFVCHGTVARSPAVPDEGVRDPHLRGIHAARATVQRLERGVATILPLLAP